jgi:putative transposase
MYEKRIGERQWRLIYEYLNKFRTIYVRNEENCRCFVEAVFWMARSGAQWRLLPKEFGSWNTVYRRFADWADRGIWYKMLYYFAKDPDMDYIMVDSTILRAHASRVG